MQRILTAASVLLVVGLVGTSSGDDAWQHVNADEQEGLAGNDIQFLESFDGETWIGTLSGLSRFKDGAFSVVMMESGRKQGGRKKAAVSSWDILRTGAGRYLVGTSRGIMTLEGMAFTGSALGGNTVAPLFRYDKQTVWALAKNTGSEVNTLYAHSDGEWKAVDYFADKKVADAAQSADGCIWVMIDGNGVVEVDAKAGGLESAVHHLQGMNVTAVFVDSKELTWCGFWGRGLASYDGESWTYYLSSEQSAVLRIDEDKHGNIWAATTSGGIWRFDRSEWTNSRRDRGPVSLLLTDSTGRVWISTQLEGGLHYWNGEAWVKSLGSGLPMRCMVEAQDGTLWAGGVLDGLHMLKK